MSKNNAKTRIIRYLTKSDITLTGEEETILARWEHIDSLTRLGTTYDDILLKHTAKFSVSKFTTNNDISIAQEVFGRSRQLNKRYLAHLHLEDLQQDLKKIRKAMFKVDPKTGDLEYPPDAKEVASLAKMHEAYTRQIHALPDDLHAADVPKPVIIFKLVGKDNEPINQPLIMDIGKALQLADSFINGVPVAEQLIDDDDTADE